MQLSEFVRFMTLPRLRYPQNMRCGSKAAKKGLKKLHVNYKVETKVLTAELTPILQMTSYFLVLVARVRIGTV